MRKFVSPYGATTRRNVVLALLGLFAAVVLFRVVYLQVCQADLVVKEGEVCKASFLMEQGNSRFLRTKKEPALRGTILDRNDVPLAVSTPVSSLWVNPKEILRDGEAISALGSALGMPVNRLHERIMRKKEASFLYIKRGMEPEVAKKILKKQLTGVYSQREYQRFYPSAHVTAQIIGFNDINDDGQEGMELMYNDWLSGTDGSSEIVRDLRGRVVDVLQEIKPPVQGQGLQLTIDKRIQYLTYLALLETAEEFSAKSATAVMLDAKTSEVLAMVSVPSGNPNNRQERRAGLVKNRAITETFEPGSVMKPFAVASALDAGLVSPGTPVNTSPGYWAVAKNVVRDVKNYGTLSVSGVIKKSSNIGTCKIALRLPKGKLQAMYESLGLGQKSHIGFPGEQTGRLRDLTRMNDFDYCTNSYGYGLSTTALQVAQAYAVLANNGVSIPASLVKRESLPEGTRLMSTRTAKQVRTMLKAAVGQKGTGNLATRGNYMEDYSVGGKTGTVHKVINGQYAKKRYRSVFAGMAPLSNPRIVMVVMVDEPQGERYYGGLVAAPIFAKVVGKTLRMMGVAPDQKAEREKQPIIQAGQKKT